MKKNPNTASVTLLQRVRESDSEACQLLALIYYPVVYRWARRSGCEHSFAEDVVQEVMLTVFRQVDPDRVGRFRTWLWSVFQSRMIDLARRQANQPMGRGGTTANRIILENSEEPNDDDRTHFDEQLVNRILDVKTEFSENVWSSFWRTTVHGDAPADVANDLEISVWAVYKAKKRCQARIIDLLAAAGAEPPKELLR